MTLFQREFDELCLLGTKNKHAYNTCKIARMNCATAYKPEILNFDETVNKIFFLEFFTVIGLINSECCIVQQSAVQINNIDPGPNRPLRNINNRNTNQR